MINDFMKSISSILYERVTSPLYGAFIISWCIWNWKILYLTIFISEEALKITKIDYLITNCNDVKLLLIYPIISTLVIILLIPFLGNGAYYISLKFNQWKIKKKNEIENNQTLTIEQSIELREELLNQTEKFAKIIKEKNDEINQINSILEQYKSRPKKENITPTKKIKPNLDDDFNNILNNPNFDNNIPTILGNASRGVMQPKDQYQNQSFKLALEYLVSAGFIERDPRAPLLFKITLKGNDLHRFYIEHNLK